MRDATIACLKVVLISLYELGRQPFGLASPAAWLRRDGAAVTCLDLAVQPLSLEAIETADLVALYVPMHTAARMAARVIERVKQINPRAHLCFYGLYAPVNESFFRRLGGGTILGGEFEEGLVSLARRLAAGHPLRDEDDQAEPVISLSKLQFLVPDRNGLPDLDRYAYATLGSGERRVTGYTEASRGCKHLCRHCPIVPVYRGQFRIVQREVVLEDIRRQVAAGARHITFGDPDFFNGPGHAIALVQALHREWPGLTYDVTIKVEHLLRQAEYLPILRTTGCLFVTSAVEAVDDRILEIFDKAHTRADFIRAVSLLRKADLTLNPTFVAFTPWTSLEGYRDFLSLIRELQLVGNVSPIQYAIRLLIPAGSRLLELAHVRDLVGPFDEALLSYPWSHPDPRMDRLHEEILRVVKEGQSDELPRRAIFENVWRQVRTCSGNSECDDPDRPEPLLRSSAPDAGADAFRFAPSAERAPVPYLSEPWYC